MKVLPFKIPRTRNEAIIVQNDREPHVYHTLHQHPEVQISLINESEGTVIIGGYIGEFKPGDIFMIGSNIPHAFRNDAEYYKGNPNLVADVTRLFIDETIPETALLNFKHVNELFFQAKRGIKLTSTLRDEISERISKLPDLQNLDRLIEVLTILNSITKSTFGLKFLNDTTIDQSIDEFEGKRLNEVIQHSLDNFPNKITLDEISAIADLTPSAFCRFFKVRTGKTYFDFLNEVRVSNASKLLLREDFTMSEISKMSGFNNLSYFNRKFKELTGLTPKKYQQEATGNQVIISQ